MRVFSFLVSSLFVWYLLFPLSCGCFARHPSTLLCSYPWDVQNACVQFVEGLKNLENLTLFKGFQILLTSIVTALVKIKGWVERKKDASASQWARMCLPGLFRPLRCSVLDSALTLTLISLLHL